MSITPNVIMICIDTQGEEHHCREEQGMDFWGIPALKRNNLPIEMRVLTNLKDTVASDALIGRLPIGARHAHSAKSHVISQGFVRSEGADFLRTYFEGEVSA
jgi:hypothetical protein